MADNRGIHRKYTVTRTDGQDNPGMKHCACRYFVIDLDHDRHAKAALEAYAADCEGDRPQLAAELHEVLAYPFRIEYCHMDAPTKFEVFMRRDEIRQRDEELRQLKEEAPHG